jgi:hypothetical protein
MNDHSTQIAALQIKEKGKRKKKKITTPQDAKPLGKAGAHQVLIGGD